MASSEQATVMVLFSPELVEQMKDWSEPVQVRLTKFYDGQYEFEARRCSQPVDNPVDKELPKEGK